MATLVEMFAGRTESLGNRSRAEISYAVFDAVDEDDVRVTANAGIPATYPGLIGLAFTEYELTERINETTWKVVARFDSGEFTEPEDPSNLPYPRRTFSTVGGTQRITQSISTVSSTPGGSPDFKRCINYDGKRVQGADILVPAHTFTITDLFAIGVVTPAFEKQIANLTGKVNDAMFEGCDAGEVLFGGATSNPISTTEVEVTYNFLVSENLTNVGIGDLIVPAKKGWEFLWVRYKNSVDASAIVKQPKNAYVEEVYEMADFSLLGL